ncbi:MAG: homocysteine S-methyltransferase family protein [Fidelibacterota bacterium]|nr:MAG: homocysteine S-methyltransferase family protein [Candidatus Neomarinimicrobiota bacterium]
MLDRLKKGEVLVADGAMGTLLLDKGLQPGECPEALSISKPDILKDIARSYLEADADIIQTNTFGGSPMKLKEYGLEDKTEEVNQRAASLVREVVGDRASVSGSCGPSGALLKPYGDTEPEVLYSGFERQIGALVEGTVDLVCVETMTDLREAVLAVEAAKAVSAGTPVMATMTFDETARGFYTIMGVSVAEAAAGLQEAGADIIGSNCGNGIENMVRIAHEFMKVSSLPVIIQSNAGKPEMKCGRLRYPESPALFAEKAREMMAAGVSIIGGCCGTTAEHIRAIREVVDSRQVR